MVKFKGCKRWNTTEKYRIMLIEILPRIWIADKTHSRSKITNVVLVKKDCDRIHSMPHFIEKQHAYANYLEKMARFLYYYTVVKMNTVILVDTEIHVRHDAYVILMAFMKTYGHVDWQTAYRKIKTKTIPFYLTSFSTGVFRLLTPV